jgi:hexosaminidase
VRVFLIVVVLAAVATAAPALPDAYLPTPPPVQLLPVPKEITWAAGEFTITPSTRIVVADRATEDDLFAARELNEEFQARFNVTLRVVKGSEVRDPRGQIVLGETALNPLSARLLQSSGISVSASSPGSEGYVLRAVPDGVVVAGSDRRGTFYGVQTLRQLLRSGKSVASVRSVTIRDRPDHSIRAVHVLLDSASAEFHTMLIDRILAPYKFNTLVAEAEHVQWDSGRPFWVPDSRGATKMQVRRLVDVAREHHIQVIPLIATLGHSEWVFAGLRSDELCRQIAYIPKRLRDEGRTQVTCDRGRAVFPAVYDPERTVTIEGKETTVTAALIRPVLQEAVDLFRPFYLHIGHDEVRGPSGVSYDLDLYLRDTIALHQFLKDQGVRTMMWGDVLYERRDEIASESLWPQLPRDIAVMAWKYEDIRDYPELAYFRQAGFPVLAASWYRTHNNFHMSRAAKAAGALGMVRTTWNGFFQNRTALTRAFQQFYTYFTAATYFWTSGRPQPDALPSEASLARRFADAWMPKPYRSRPIPGALIDLKRAVTQRHIDNDGTGWQGKGPEYDLRGVQPGRSRFGGVQFEILDPSQNGGKSIVMLKGERDVAETMPSRVTVALGRRAGCVAVLHATLDRATSFGDVVGRYEFSLTGGTRATVNLMYGRNISSWLADLERGIPSIEQEIAWTGKTHAGNDVNLQMLLWKNPQPDRQVESIDLFSAGGRSSPVVFAITTLDRCP